MLELKGLLEIVLLAVTIGYAIWRWRRDAFVLCGPCRDGRPPAVCPYPHAKRPAWCPQKVMHTSLKMLQLSVLVIAVSWVSLAWAQTADVLPPDLARKPLRQWQLDGVTLFLVAQIFGRGWTAVTQRGGLWGIGRAIIFGSSTAAKLLLGCAMLCAGCVHVRGIRTAPDGSILQVSTTRCFWLSEGINFSVGDTNGFRATLAVQKSGPDATAIEAAAKGAAQGAVGAAR